MAYEYNAYNQANHTISGVQQVVMLFDGAINHIKRAQESLEKKDYESRYNSVGKACAIIAGLRSCLDHEQGGEQAEALDQYYNDMDMQLVRMTYEENPELFSSVLRDLKRIRDVWDEIAKTNPEQRTATQQISAEQGESFEINA